MAFGRKNPEGTASDVFAEVVPANEPKSHNLAEIAVDAGTIDVNPSTASIPIATEALLPNLDPIPSQTTALATPEVVRSNYSRRDSLRGQAFDAPEPAAMLTAERLIDTSNRFRPAPESGFRRFLYFLSLRSINLGDSLAVR